MSDPPSESRPRRALPSPGLRIPTPYRRGFEALAQLPDDEQSALLDAVQTRELLSTTRLAARMGDAAPSLKVPPSEALDALFSLIVERDSLPRDDEELPEELSQSRDLDLDADSRTRLAELLAALLEAEAVALTAKATDVLSEHENVLTSTRVLTDIRPIFPRDDSMTPAGGGLVNMLKIEFLGSAGTDSIYFALDQDDLVELMQVLDRALKKTEALRQWLREAGMTYWAYSEGDGENADSG